MLHTKVICHLPFKAANFCKFLPARGVFKEISKMFPTEKVKKSKIPYVLGKIFLLIKHMTTGEKTQRNFSGDRGG